MEPQQPAVTVEIWTIVQWALTAILIPASIYVWKWWERRQERKETYQLKESQDTREFDQQTRGDALNQVLQLNRELVANQISLANGRLDRHREGLESLHKDIQATADLFRESLEKQRVDTQTRWEKFSDIILAELKSINGSMKVNSGLQSQQTELLRGMLREVSRWEEQSADIDLILHEILGAVMARRPTRTKKDAETTTNDE